MKFYMLVLALDTTTRRGSAALTRDGVLIAAYIGDATITHGERLPGDLIRLLSAHALRLSDVDLFAVAAGPGSFTGLRIGIATQQGLALANNRPLVGISALDAVNHATRFGAVPALLSADAVVGVWIDAQRGQVFSALYRVDRAIEGPSVEKPADVLARWVWPGPDVFTGDGALEYSPLIQQAFPDAQIVLELPPLAPSIGRLAEEHLREHGANAPDAIRPIYVRRSDAELARDRVKS
jgi:tRNA threonylcarbamoyladenosine biosynthesis protein TsaB